MYPVDGGGETTSEAALGVLILWFCWLVRISVHQLLNSIFLGLPLTVDLLKV